MADVALKHGMGTLRTTCHPKKIHNVPQPYPDDAPAACKKGTCKHDWEARWREGDSQPKKIFAEKAAGLAHLTGIYNKKLKGEERILTPKPVPGQSRVVLLEPYALAWLSKKKGISEQTRDKYRIILGKHVFPHIGKTPISRIKEAHIVKLVEFLYSEDKKTGKTPVYPGTVKSLMKYLLKPIFALAIKEGLTKEQPITDEIDIRDNPDVDRYVPSSGEVHAIGQQIRRFFRAAIYLMAGCGLREAEALAVTKDCIRGDRLFIKRQWRGKYGFKNLKYDRTKKGRWIPLDPIVLHELERHIEEYGVADGQPLFYSSGDRNKPFGAATLEDYLREACLVLGLADKKIRPHNLRHFFASCCVERGVELAEVSRMLGHKSVETTYKIYYQLPKNLDRIKLAINGFLSAEVPDNVILLGAHQLAAEDNASEINELVARLKAISGMEVILQPYGIAA